MLNQAVGPDHPKTIFSSSVYTSPLFEADRLARSQELIREAFQRSERVFGVDNLLTLSCKVQLAVVLISMGNADQGTSLLREACEGIAQTVGQEHPVVFANKSVLAITLIGAPATKDEGFLLLQHCLDTQTKTFGIDNRTTLVTAARLVLCLWKDSRTSEALALCEKILTALPDGPRRSNKHSQVEIRKIEELKLRILADSSEEVYLSG
ncbi:hypothetical protein QBC42DRAFT_325023 [Cladorrhinum samala]|uniref:Uncharacterized protein n=1 Tax=Cladorrhinum samala TaxID=585594 RepID=A0AAV9HRA2_9PEZI|nr:hypothetical protein QBC42DRAFT_325023 [Cladorrhinum samala]